MTARAGIGGGFKVASLVTLFTIIRNNLVRPG
jgi:hypothetical protein